MGERWGAGKREGVMGFVTGTVLVKVTPYFGSLSESLYQVPLAGHRSEVELAT